MNNLPVTLSAGLEVALNRLISIDPATQKKIISMSGKVVGIELQDLNLQFHLLPTADRVLVQGMYEGEVDATLRGSSLSMLRMGLRDDASDSLFSGEFINKNYIARNVYSNGESKTSLHPPR